MNNIVDFNKKKDEVKKQKPPKKDGPKHPPLINLPIMTKILLGIMILCHVIVHFLLPDQDQAFVILNFGFIPSIWTGQSDYGIDVFSVISPLTYMMLHGGWMHIVMNVTMLMAFGAGVEKWMGPTKFLFFFILCGVVAVLFEIIIHPFSMTPVIGASGALSGLFAAILVMLQSQGRLPTGKYGIWPIAAIWMGISILFGLVGGTIGQSPIAWVTHLGGFITGFIALKSHYFKY